MEQNEEREAEAEWGADSVGSSGLQPKKHAKLQRFLPARSASMCRRRRNFGLKNTAQSIYF